ncbi:MAG: hypothetical protein R3F24_04445 [Gammaproteobacteria bacterium]
MNLKKSKPTFLLVAATLGSIVMSGVGGCTSALDKSADFDRHRFSGLVQPFDKPGTIYFDVKFTSEFPEDDPVADAARQTWLAAWLVQRRLCAAGFDVVQRRSFDYLEDNPAGYDQRWEVQCRPPLLK